MALSITGNKQTDVGNNYTANAEITGTENAKKNYILPTNLLQQFTISPATMTLTAGTYNGTYDGEAHAVEATASVPEGTTITYSIGGGDFTGDKPSITDAGTVNYIAKATNPNYKVATAEGTLTVSPRPVTLTSESASKDYDGTALTLSGVTAGGDGFVQGEGFTYEMTGSQVDIGESDNEFTYTLNEGTKAGNYTITPVYGKLTVTPKAVTLTAKDAKKTYNSEALTEGGFTVEGQADTDTHTFTVVMTKDSTITNVGTQKNVIATVDGIAVKTGEATAVGNYTVTTADGTLTIDKAELKVIPTKGQSKKFAANDPKAADKKTNSYAFTVADKSGKVDEKYKSWVTGELAREAGEAVGDYKYNMGTVKDNTGADNIILTLADEVFTIKPEFAGSVALTTSPLTTRTQKLTFAVAGIEVPLGKNEQPTLKLAKPAGVTSTITDTVVSTNQSYSISVTGAKVEDSESKLKYISYLPANTYKIMLELPKRDGTSATVEATTITVKKDAIKEMSIFTNNPVNDQRELIGFQAGDRVSFSMADKFAAEPRKWTKGQDQEIIKATITVNGVSIYGNTDHYIEISELGNRDISDDLIKHLISLGERNSAKVNITLEVVTPDLSPTKFTREFTYDYRAIQMTSENIKDLNNRAFSFQVIFPELAKITEASITGFNAIDVSKITYTDEKDGYGKTATIPLSYPTSPLPSSAGAVVTITYEDYSGNKETYEAKGIPMATTAGIMIYKIEPQAGLTMNSELSIRETNAIRLSGIAVGHEVINIRMIASNGWRQYRTLTVGSDDTTWVSAMDDYWSVIIGNRNSEDSLRKQLDFPIGIPVELFVSYADVAGGSYRTVLIYDEDVQEPTMLTPAYPGMKVLVGYTEPLSTVQVTWSGGTLDATVNPWGQFVVQFPEGVYDPEITLTVTDVGGNTKEFLVSVPGRSRDVNMTVNVNPLGALIQDEIGMVKGTATPVTLEELDKGPIEIPILAANYFPVGKMTITRDAGTGKVSFTPVIDEAYAAENPGTYFNVYTKTPTAKEVERENRGAGLEIANGYTPEAKAKSFWFVYETQATLTEEQLMLEEGTATLDITGDATFTTYQGLTD